MFRVGHPRIGDDKKDLFKLVVNQNLCNIKNIYKRICLAFIMLDHVKPNSLI